MRVRKWLSGLALVGAWACEGRGPTDGADLQKGGPPDRIAVTASMRVLSFPGRGLQLEVSALLRNPTTSTFDIIVGGQCPLPVRIFPDPTGAPITSIDGMMVCPTGGPSFALAPGDTAVVTRMISPDTLATFSPGMYGINVAVTTSGSVVGAWAGAVQLPLGVP